MDDPSSGGSEGAASCLGMVIEMAMADALAAFDLWDDEEQSEATESLDGYKERVVCECPLDCCVNRGAVGKRLRRRLAHERMHAKSEAMGERLLRACEAGDAAAVAQLLHCGGEERGPCWPDEMLQPPLVHVASASAAAAFAKHAHKFFWSRGGGIKALIRAAAKGHATVVRALLETGVNPDGENSGSSTRALPAAVQAGSIECVQILLEFGADLSARVGNGMTTLHLAASAGHADVLEVLLAANPELDIADEYGQTALSIAAARGLVECVRLLLQHGANIHNRDKESLTPLLIAARNYQMTSIPWEYQKLEREIEKEKGCKRQRDPAVEDRAGTVRALVAAGADLNEFASIDVYGREVTVLMFAMQSGSEEVVQTLIDLGVDINYRTSEKETALHFSACVTESCIKKLLSAGAYLEAQNESGMTALSIAAKAGYEMSVKQFLEAGAQVMTMDNEGCTPLHLAAKIGQGIVVGMLLEAGANVEAKSIDGHTAMHFAATTNRFCIMALAEAGASVNDMTNDGRTPLHFAVNSWNPECLETIVELGADLLAVDHQGWNALHFAALHGRDPIVARLVEFGIPPDSRNFNGQTPLHIAIINSQNHLSPILIWKLRANVNARDDSGRTVLHIAARSTDDRILQELVEFGADRRIRDNDGFLPVDLASNPIIQRILRYWALAG